MMRALQALLLLSCLAQPAVAQDCGDTQADLNACAGAIFKQADTELNAAYRQITARLAQNGAARRALVEAQRAWIGFRDAECNFATIGTEGGSARPMLSFGCAEDLTRRRIADLRGYMECGPGGACAAPPRGR